jgi:tRNA (guanine37-N1)-methyltransferase
MVMRPQVWGRRWTPCSPRPAGPAGGAHPAGRPFTQATAQEWAAERLVFACGRYEGSTSA